MASYRAGLAVLASAIALAALAPSAAAGLEYAETYAFQDPARVHAQFAATWTNGDAVSLRSVADADGDGEVSAKEAQAHQEILVREGRIALRSSLLLNGRPPQDAPGLALEFGNLEGPVTHTGPVTMAGDAGIDFDVAYPAGSHTLLLRAPGGLGLGPPTHVTIEVPHGATIVGRSGLDRASLDEDLKVLTGMLGERGSTMVVFEVPFFAAADREPADAPAPALLAALAALAGVAVRLRRP